jgi:hypothetical protein
LTPAAAWRELVDHVVSRDSSGRYDAVILLGDVVHSENEYFEAYGHLEEGARRLVEAGVPVYAIAGNHDVQVLPRLAGHLPGFTVIGAGGKWERVPLSKDGRPFLHLLGWSFPALEVPWSPLDTLPGPTTDGLPEIGLLHAHLDASGSRHAPVSRHDLERTHPHAWLLGHIHRPDSLDGPRPRGYLGSLVGLDATETGAHGPWRLEVERDGRVRLELLPLAPLRWEILRIDVSELHDADDVERALLAGLETLPERLQIPPSTRAVTTSVRLVGRCRFSRELEEWLVRKDPGRLVIRRGETLFVVCQVLDETRPAIDLERVARERTPPGLLAARLLRLRAGERDDDTLHFLSRARMALEEVAGRAQWAELESPDRDEIELRELAFEAGLKTLELLLESKENA